MALYYEIRRETDGLFLQGVEANERYSQTATAPTMGNRHIHAEYSTVWEENRKVFERLTAANYIKIIFEEFRWKDRKPFEIKITPFLEGNE